jgi:precorrin-6B methylase 1
MFMDMKHELLDLFNGEDFKIINGTSSFQEFAATSRHNLEQLARMGVMGEQHKSFREDQIL